MYMCMYACMHICANTGSKKNLEVSVCDRWALIHHLHDNISIHT